MDELVDSSRLSGDHEALRRRVRSDGYVFLRGVVDPSAVREAEHAVVDALRRAGWVRAGGPPGRVVPVPPPHPTAQREAWADAGYRQAASSAPFNRLPYLPGVRGLMQRVMGATAFSYPVKILRVVYPERMVSAHGGMQVHQDYAVVGQQDMFTTWVPLMDVPRALGGLCVLPGGHLEGGRRPSTLPVDAPGWRTADYRVGDVLVFHCLTYHAALPNTTGWIRLSADFRWQLADDPVPAGLIWGPNPPGVELWSRMFRRTGWWQAVPAGLRLIDPSPRGRTSGDGPQPPSRYVGTPATWSPLHPRVRHH
jgi:hypothetical protein